MVSGPAETAVLRSSASDDGLTIDAVSNTVLGVELVFSGNHLLEDGDYIQLSGINADTQSDQYNAIHQITIRDSVTIRIPISFPQGEFIEPALPNTVRWSRVSQGTFVGIKAEQFSGDGRGYIVCWSPDGETTTDFTGQAGSITVKVSPEMREARIGLTTTEVGTSGALIIAFQTSDMIRYSQVTGQMKLVVEFQVGLNGAGDAYVPGLIPKSSLLTAMDGTFPTTRATARQDVCGRMFLELWSEADQGFPMPEGCYYTVDDVNTEQPLAQLHIIFSARNHLMPLTRYMMVVNAEVQEELSLTFPDPGAIFVWSMDDIDEAPYSVVELGMASPQPTNRQPPRDSFGNLLVTGA
eukprot:2928680-Amphidinium_carterae.1